MFSAVSRAEDVPTTEAEPAQAAPAPMKPPAARPAPRLRKRKWGRLVWLAVVAALAIGGWQWSRTREAEAVPVSTIAVQRGTVRDFVTSVAAGRVSARQEATLRAEIAARVMKIHHRRGDRVKAGEPLVSYDAAELDRRVKAAQAGVALARAQTLQAQTSAATAEANAERVRKLRATGAIAEAEADNQEGQAKALLRGAEAAQAGVSQAMANVELARVAAGKAIVLAPFSGVVLTTAVEAGETAAPGAPLLQLADTSELHVDLEIDEADLGRIAVGMPAEVSLDAFPGVKIEGKVTEIAPSVTRDPRGGRSVALDVAVPPDARLLVGMSAEVDIIVAVRENTVWLPPNAVLGRGAERTVFVVENGVVKKRAVDVGIATWEAVEVKRGLSGGERVVASLATLQLSDGARVTEKGKSDGGGD
jgi:HlyD family secretion protein